ncbi:hypothetical protein P2Q00_10690 [Streptomyces coacervatus]|uniref:hypothetical protein n=1 Tax=Streptomyces coacervatus TaxID=647381 RepID=UPI0023D9D699|nr:hypothetical protein [Streptomyces coacervatus]MDF2265910.1 hypothetical protein [Streptomyces coacervatus]
MLGALRGQRAPRPHAQQITLRAERTPQSMAQATRPNSVGQVRDQVRDARVGDATDRLQR